MSTSSLSFSSGEERDLELLPLASVVDPFLALCGGAFQNVQGGAESCGAEEGLGHTLQVLVLRCRRG
jgi:hypothetical protein